MGSECTEKSTPNDCVLRIFGDVGMTHVDLGKTCPPPRPTTEYTPVSDEGVVSAEGRFFMCYNDADIGFCLMPRMIGHMTNSSCVVNTETGRILKDFGTCSYLGAHTLPAAVEASNKMCSEQGVYVPASRIWLEHEYMKVLEDLISEATGGFALLAPKAHTGSIMWATHCVNLGDAIVMDSHAHKTIQNAALIAKTAGIPVVNAVHSDLESTLKAIDEAASLCTGKVWFATDGLHSMHGTMLKPEFALEILKRNDRTFIYVDDAHGTGWAGEGGRGAWLTSFPMKRACGRMIVLISMYKAVACEGAALVFPTKKERDFHGRSGAGILLSGPMSTSAIAANIEFFRWIRTEEGKERQRNLVALLERFTERMKGTSIPIPDYDSVPIRSIHTGTIARAIKLAQDLADDGFYTCPCCFPVVPRGHAALRVSFNAALDIKDVDALCDSLIKHGTDLPPVNVHVVDPAFGIVCSSH